MLSQEANLLEREYIWSDRIRRSYVFRWQDKMITIIQAERLLEAHYRKKQTKTKIMTLFEAKQKAHDSTKGSKGKVYIDVDDKGFCSISKKFSPESSVFCYRNGSEIALDSYTKSTTEKETLLTMATPKVSSKKVAATKVAAKTAPAKSSNGKSAPAKEVKKLPAGIKELAAKEIIALLKKGKAVTTPGGTPHNVKYLETCDPTSLRKCIVAA